MKNHTPLRFALVSVFALALAAAPVRADDDNALGILATAEIASFNQLQQDVTALGAAIGQPMISMGLLGAGQLISSPGLLGVDRDKPIRVAFFGDLSSIGDDEGFFASAVIALPLSDADGASYFKSVETGATKKSDANGYRVYDIPNSPLGETLEIVVANGYAFLSTDGDISEAELLAIAARGADALAVPGVRGTIRLSAPVAPFAAMLRKGVAEALDNGLATADLANDQDAAAVRADIEYLVDLFGQNDALALGLDISAGRGLSIWGRTDATPGSDAAAIAASLRTPEDGVLSVLGNADAAVEFAAAFDPAIARRFVSGYLRVFSLFTKAIEKNMDNADNAKGLAGIKDLLSIVEKAFSQADYMTGSIAESVSMDAEGIPSYRFAAGCTDPEKMHAVSKELLDALKGNETFSFFGSEDLGTREANGLVIHRMRMAYDFDKLLSTMGVDPNAPLPPPAAGQLQLMRAMYGKLGGNTMEYATRDGITYAAWAPGEAPLDAVLASLSRPEQAGALSALFSDVPELGTSVVRGYMDYSKIMPTMLKSLPAEVFDPNEEEFKAVVEKILSTPDPIGFVAWRDGDSLLSVVRLDENVFKDFSAWGAYMGARFRRQWEERAKQQQDDDEEEDDDDLLSGLSEEDRKKIGDILDKGDFDDNK